MSNGVLKYFERSVDKANKVHMQYKNSAFIDHNTKVHLVSEEKQQISFSSAIKKRADYVL